MKRILAAGTLAAALSIIAFAMSFVNPWMPGTENDYIETCYILGDVRVSS